MMKKIILIVALISAILFQSYAQQKKIGQVNAISLSPEKWLFKAGKVKFLEYKGRTAMKIGDLSGPVLLKDLIFKDGTIEYDVEPAKTEFAAAVYFHRKDEKEQEIVYLRVPKMADVFANEGIQYCPYINGVNMWDMYPQYQAPAQANAEGWNRIRILISGRQMKVFVNNRLRLEVPKLESGETEGSIAFEGDSYISNVIIKPGEVEGLSPLEGVDLTKHESNYIRNWSVTSPVSLVAGREPTTMIDIPLDELFREGMEAERDGLVNLTRRFGGNEKRKIVWLRATITAKENVKTNLQLGFSDEIWLYLNDQITYADKNIFRQNMKKYPDGRISVRNGSTALNLKEGENQLLIGVANDFYGWGIIARLENTEKIVAIAPYSVPEKTPVENIRQYPGTYISDDGSGEKLIFTLKGDQLMVKTEAEEAVSLSYRGKHLFKMGMGIALQFNPESKNVIKRENGFETKFVQLN